jgi:uncharacterized lipoprotein YbaY
VAFGARLLLIIGALAACVARDDAQGSRDAAVSVSGADQPSEERGTILARAKAGLRPSSVLAVVLGQGGAAPTTPLLALLAAQAGVARVIGE